MDKNVYEYISKQTNDPIVERRKCTVSGEDFAIFQSDLEFYDKISPSFNGKQYKIPSPTLSPDSRQQRRLAWRNEKKLYHDICDLTGKRMISLYSPKNPCTVYHHEAWWSDKRNPLEYGIDFNPSKTFFEQFTQLILTVPRVSTYNKRTSNTEYGNNLVGDKNCYMLFVTFSNQDSYYGHTLGYCKNCIDCLWAVQSQNCYECIKIENCYECFFCLNCSECFSSRYLEDCIKVDRSAFCIGLRNKKNHFLNRAYSKQDFNSILERLNNDESFFQQTLSSFEQLKSGFPNRSTLKEQSENVVGDYLSNCKNCFGCYDIMMAEDLRYCYDCANLVDSMDATNGGSEFSGGPTQLLYECENCFTNHHTLFSSCVALGSKDMLYCDSCDACTNCFGCTGLKQKSYCILNKQYTPEAYEVKVSEIIEKMIEDSERGEFFPIYLSLFGYNETEAQTYYPMDRSRAKEMGYNRKVEEEKVTNNIRYDTQKMTDKELLETIFYCQITKKPFKLIKQEVDFYRKYNLSIPKFCFDQRHLERMKRKNARKIRLSSCNQCNMVVETTKITDDSLYCDECYKKEIYG